MDDRDICVVKNSKGILQNNLHYLIDFSSFVYHSVYPSTYIIINNSTHLNDHM